MVATPNLQAVNIEDEMKKSYLEYSMSVIVGRALPDVRDGLKPVHRRVLFAMEEMKKIQPQMTALREKYKKDSARMNQEMMKLYKEHKVNPLGGCLPMVLQLPFFVALYNVLSVSIELRQSPFISFWIKDLSVYDPYYILPVLMGVSMIFTMKMTSTTVEPQQQKIMMFMNIAFIFLFAWLPAGLLLYISLSNVLSIGQQLYVRRLLNIKTHTAARPS